METPVETSLEVVTRACNAAYKKGMIDAARVVCSLCRKEPPTWGGQYFRHPSGPCCAGAIHVLIEAAGGWVAEWPQD